MTQRLPTLIAGIAGLLVTLDFAVTTAQLGKTSVEQHAERSPTSAGHTKRSLSTTLKREGAPWGGETDRDFQVPPLVAPQGRLLVTARDTLYMLNSRKQILWKYYVGAPVVDKLILDSSGIIHGIAMDGIEFAVDLDGNRRWAHCVNGRANYSQIALYDGDQYLVVIDYSGYRESLSDNTLADVVALCRGGETIWSQEFPRNAELCVWSSRIFAVAQTRKRTTLIELRPPATSQN